MEILLSVLVIFMFVGTLIYVLVKSPNKDKTSILLNVYIQNTIESEEEVFRRLHRANANPNFLRIQKK